jgi:electron transfer flavoprotein-quinone oxidoreductase
LSEEKLDVIVVGGGPAGAIAAYLLAEAGLETVLFERGNTCGSKNVTGGRIYTHSLARVFPDFALTAPLERPVSREAVSFITADKLVTVDLDNPAWGATADHSYTVRRVSLDGWLADRAEAAGAMIINGIRVDDLIMENGAVCGVIAGGDEMRSNAVIIAEGVNPMLARRAGLLSGDLNPAQTAVGVKMVVSMESKEIESRFHLRPGEGMAQLLVGDCSKGVPGGGFIYTNKESVALGIIFTIAELVKSGVSVPDAIESFRAHPGIAPLLSGGKAIEYSAHLVPEGGWSMKPRLYGDGVLVAGDTAGFVLNCGYMVRGIDLAITSGRLAAETVIGAKSIENFSAAALAAYEQKVLDSHIGLDLKTFEKVPRFLEDTPAMFSAYPALAADLLTDLFTARGGKPERIRSLAARHIGKAGWLRLIRDGLKGVRAL